jgi:glycosyltransferase involved in cell wall biosynthesis
MLTAATPQIAYLSFDAVPAPKGAAIHIESFVRALGQSWGQVALVTVSAHSPGQPAADWPAVTHTILPAAGKTLIDRVLHFRQHLQTWLQGKQFEVMHVRSIFEGFPIAQNKPQYCRWLIFEVNGLPSIELKYRYPKVVDDPELMHKLLSQEQICLEAADQIITPSPVTKDYLVQQRGISSATIHVIPNGVDPALVTYHAPRSAPSLETLNLLYFGTLSTWQGVDLALEALALYRRDFDARLTIVGPARGNQVVSLEKLAHKLAVTDAIQLLAPVSQTALVTLMHQADAILAPLKANDRNLVQGCCPLKVLEGMASGTPVITSDLPVTQALGETQHHFLAVCPGSAKAMKDALLRLRTEPTLRLRLSQAARSQIETHYTWNQAHRSLLQVYRQLGRQRDREIERPEILGRPQPGEPWPRIAKAPGQTIPRSFP